MKRASYLLVFFFVIGCSKEEITVYTSFMKNSTSHQIKILPYYNGTIRNTNITLMPGDSIKIASGYDRGIVNHGGFNSSLLIGDSITVVFDNLYTISHYFTTPFLLSRKHYLYTSRRNVMNYLSWEYKHDDKSRNRREAFYLFRFVEQDYLDSKN